MISESRNHRITVLLLGSGYAVAMLADYEDMNWNTDVVKTSMKRYATLEEARAEAKVLADDEKVPYKPEEGAQQ